MSDLYQQIIDTYTENGSVKRTAEALGTNVIKVRRVLLTEGLWHSKTSNSVAELLKQGLSVPEIADRLVMSEKNVQSYMPYTRGEYGKENRSNEAIRSEEYRERMQKAVQNQVNRTEAKMKKDEKSKEELAAENAELLRRLIEQEKMLQAELQAEKDRLLAAQRSIYDSYVQKRRTMPVALNLHLEMKLGYYDEENIEVLKKYGRMENAMTRDLIVPGTMTLHGLHYAIQKAFGWQNSHLHSFRATDEEYQQMTGGLAKEWMRQVGVYFRSLSEDYEDIYWDDDYEEGESVKSWMKSKYCGPYIYDGVGEHYLPAQREMAEIKKAFPAIQRKSTKQNTWGMYFEADCRDLLERLEIRGILKTPANKTSWEEWKLQKEETLKAAEGKRKLALKKYMKLEQELDAVADKIRKFISDDGAIDPAAYDFIRELEDRDVEMNAFLVDTDPKIMPALSELCYRYDYGDDWEVRITCTNVWFDRYTYAQDEHGYVLDGWKGLTVEEVAYEDAFGNRADAELVKCLTTVDRKEKPVCTAWDGMSVMDDVGGIDGFCEFLQAINGKDTEKKKQEKEWARSLGWTGRMPKAGNLL